MFRNFLIVGTQRTGSSALFSGLNRHPDVACGRELTLRVPWFNKLRVAKGFLAGDFNFLAPTERELIQQVYDQETRWLGFKLLFRSSDKWLAHPRFSPALWLDRFQEHMRWLRNCPEIYVVHIVRCNAVEWLKSKYLSETTGMYTGKAYPGGIKIDIRPREAVKRLQAKNWVDGRLATLANSNCYLRVYYEDFLRCNEAVLNSVWQFLQCDAEKAVKAPRDGRHIQRQSNGFAADYISNYDRLRRELERRDLLNSNLCKSQVTSNRTDAVIGD
jgi:LPS sulfotransferase NodH